ncbi:hypothetical protein HMPREF1869_00307 [Bacteroidales bacterium KA00251]|nr:hypothetical protein HMPREF1869_00307 [Bacteroidales bacterium KA00251]
MICDILAIFKMLGMVNHEKDCSIQLYTAKIRIFFLKEVFS